MYNRLLAKYIANFKNNALNKQDDTNTILPVTSEKWQSKKNNEKSHKNFYFSNFEILNYRTNFDYSGIKIPTIEFTQLQNKVNTLNNTQNQDDENSILIEDQNF